MTGILFWQSGPFLEFDRIAAASADQSAGSENGSAIDLPFDDDDDDQLIYVPALEIEHSSRMAVVLETGRQRKLYNKSGYLRHNIPAASKIMTALLACERLPLDTQVTISRVAAEADRGNPAGDGIVLETGDKYPLEYLLLRLFFYNSDAAAIAIAEQISGVEERFVELMNSRAQAMELSDTVFRNATGNPVYRQSEGFLQPDMIADPDSLNGESYPTSEQYSTVYDLARLLGSAMLDQNFAGLIRKDSEYLVLEGQTLVSMQNELHRIWALSERSINGAFYSSSGSYSSMVAVGRAGDINIIMVLSGGSRQDRLNDLLRIQQGVGAAYTTAVLVEAGERFTGEQEQTIDGEPFGLVFNKTVYYVRPVEDIFLRSTVRYNSFGPHSRPIQRSMTVGQVIFELKDGTTIAVDVSPDRQILSTITVLDRALNELQNNRNLSSVILLSASILFLILLFRVLLEIKRVISLIRLIIWEKRSHR